MSDDTAMPRHIGYILDGNRRWAKAHSAPPYEGHLAGYEAVKQVVFDTIDAGVPFVSIYGFSTENWKRSQDEVSKLMKLAMRIFQTDLQEFVKRGIRIYVLGVKDDLDEKLVAASRKAEAKTAHLTRGTVCICFNYGGQREIADAAAKIVQQGIPPEEVTERTIAEHLYRPDVPAMDVVVRTSGEQRLSNFMLWRAAYAEFLFLEKNWPDMQTDDVYDIIEKYRQRGRRYGK